jgi:trans-aconitate 2-methyltransferase
MADWNPDLYRRYEDERTRPARDLLAQVTQASPRRVVDLGCGPGNSTELLVQRFPQAQVTGTDNSESMLVSARQRLPGVAFELSDIATWQPVSAPDLIYTNAALQWVGGHEALIPRLFALLVSGGVLAIQMPDNRSEPSHQLMRELASEAPYNAYIPDAHNMRSAILPLASYYDLLAPQAEAIDVWHSIYQHPMASAASIVEWVRGTGLKPFIERLPVSLQPDFLAEYERRIDGAYAARADGRRLLAFPRLFIVARRK